MTEFQKKIRIHEELLDDYIKAAEERRHVILRSAYHDNYDERIQKLLIDKTMTKIPAIVYLRGKPDLFDISPTLKCYYVDCKTLDRYRPPANGSTIPNLSIEMTSFAFDYDMARFGIDTLIAIRYPPPYNIDRGFWLRKNSRTRYRPSGILVPDDADKDKVTAHKEIAREVFGSDIPFYPSHNPSDSGDLFILMKANSVLQMLDWKDLI